MSKYQKSKQNQFANPRTRNPNLIYRQTDANTIKPNLQQKITSNYLNLGKKKRKTTKQIRQDPKEHYPQRRK